MFGKLFGNRAKEAVNKFSGSTDFLEGLCAACALVAAADGEIDDKEFDMTLRVIQGNTAIAAGFNNSQIEQAFSRMQKNTGTRSGKSLLKNEIREVLDRDKTGQMGLAIALAALDVADSGGISESETVVLKDICQLTGQNFDKLIAG